MTTINPEATKAAKRIVSETDSANGEGHFHNTPHDREYVVARALLEAKEEIDWQMKKLEGEANQSWKNLARAEKAEAKVAGLLKALRAIANEEPHASDIPAFHTPGQLGHRCHVLIARDAIEQAERGAA